MELEKMDGRNLLETMEGELRGDPSAYVGHIQTILLRRLQHAERLEAGIKELISGWGKRDLLESFNAVEQLIKLLEGKP